MSDKNQKVNLLQAFKDAANSLSSNEMLISDEFTKPEYNENSEFNLQNIPFSVSRNTKAEKEGIEIDEIFAFKASKAKEVPKVSYNQKLYFSLESLLKTRTFYQSKNGQIKYEKIPKVESLTLGQIRNIILKMFIQQHLVFEGYSSFTTFFSCLWLFESFYLRDDEQSGTENTNQKKSENLKSRLLKTAMKLFLLVFIQVQTISNEIFSPEKIHLNDWSSFDFAKAFGETQTETVGENRTKIFGENQLVIPNSDIVEAVNNEKIDRQRLFKQQKSVKDRNRKTMSKIYDGINSDIKYLKGYKNNPNPLVEKCAKEILDLIEFERCLYLAFSKEEIPDIEKIWPFPDEVNDIENNSPGFYQIFGYIESDTLATPPELSYEDLKKAYMKTINDLHSVEDFIDKALSTEPRRMEDLLDLFISWNSSNLNVNMAVRFYFFRRMFPYYSESNYELNQVRISKTQYYAFSKFAGEDFSQLKGGTKEGQNIVRMKNLFSKFFSFCFRVLIYRPEKLHMHLLKTVIAQWVRNIYQINKFDSNAKGKGKETIFSYDGDSSAHNENKNFIRDIFYSILHCNFKYYICYSFLNKMLKMDEPLHMMFLYSFLFLDSKNYRENRKYKYPNKFLDTIYEFYFYLLLYKFLNNENSTVLKITNDKKMLMIDFFNTHFCIIKKNVDKEYRIEEDPKTKKPSIYFDCNIDKINEDFDKFLGGIMDKDIGGEAKSKLNTILNKSEKNLFMPQNKLASLEKSLKDINDNIDMYLKNPQDYKFEFDDAAYPFLEMSKINK